MLLRDLDLLNDGGKNSLQTKYSDTLKEKRKVFKRQKVSRLAQSRTWGAPSRRGKRNKTTTTSHPGEEEEKEIYRRGEHGTRMEVGTIGRKGKA